MRKIRKSFAVLAMMLSMCMVIPATVHANELTPDSTPTATIAPDETSESSGEIPADPTASPEITTEPDETPVAEETASPEVSVLPEATPDVTASPEATPTVPIRRAPSAVTPMSVMKSGVDFNIAIKRLSGQTVSDGWNGVYAENTTIKAFVVTEDAPPEGATTIDLNTFPTGSGGQPLLAWFDSATGTVYCQSTTPRTTLGGDCTSMFQNMTALEKVDFHWTRVAPTNMSDMFCFCRKLTSLDVSGWNTSKVTDMSEMFKSCHNLPTLDVSNWDTSNVTNMSYMFGGCDGLTVIDVSNLDTRKVTNMSYMFHYCNKLAALDVSNWNTSSVTDMSWMFNDCSKLDDLDVSGWDTSKVKDMWYMFRGCRSLTALDVSNWDTGSVTVMAYMFSGCSNLASLNVSNWKTGSVTYIAYMFSDCGNLTSLDVSKWDVSNVTNMSAMFGGCGGLPALDLSNWDTSNVKYMSDVFKGDVGLRKMVFGSGFTIPSSEGVSFPTPANTVSGAKSNGRWGLDSEAAATSYDAAGLNTLGKTAGALTGTWYAQLKTGVEQPVMETGEKFRVAIRTLAGDQYPSGNRSNDNVKSFARSATAPGSGVTTADISDAQDGSILAWFDSATGTVYLYSEADKVLLNADCSEMFNVFASVTSIDTSMFDTSQVTNMSSMFKGCIDLTSLDVSGFDTSKVTDMTGMFMQCLSLKDIDVSGFDVSRVTGMSHMFEYDSSLVALSVSEWNTHSVTDMRQMLAGCSSLTVLDVSGWDTSNVTDMAWMFYDNSALARLDVSGFDTSKVTDMAGMFGNCSGVSVLDVSGFNTSKVGTGPSWSPGDMHSMFEGCSKLTMIDVSGFDTSSVVDMNQMFDGCSDLTSLDVSGFNTSKATNMSSMFGDCQKLATLDVSKWNTGNATDVSGMFNGCSSLTSLGVSGWDTSKVTTMSQMFGYCQKLATLDVSNWNTGSVTDMTLMFVDCEKLTALDVAKWNTSNVTSMFRMFNYCENLTTLDVSKWDTSKVIGMNNMFADTALNKVTFGFSFIIPSNAKSVFPTPSKTTSGAVSNGKWGLGSEEATTSYDADGFNTLGQTAGALTGTWYAQKAAVATVTFSPVNSDDVSDKLFGTMPAQTITGSGTLNPVAYTVSDPYKLTFLGWTTEKTSWRNGQANGRFYADQATYDAKDGDATLYAYYVPSDRVLKIRVLDLNGSPVSGVTVKYWIRFSDSYDAAANANKGTVVTDDTGYAADAKYRLVYYRTEDGVADRTDSWAGHYVIPTGGYNFQITSAPEGYKFAAGKFGDAFYGYENLSGTQNLSAPDDYTLSSAPTISAKSDGSYLVTLYVSRPATITYDANGGSGTMETQTLSAAGPLNPIAFTRDGYWFTGWNTAKDGSGTAYANQAEFTPAGKDVTLYAQWKTGVELPEAGYPGDPNSRIVGLGIALFGVLMIAVMFSKDEK